MVGTFKKPAAAVPTINIVHKKYTRINIGVQNAFAKLEPISHIIRRETEAKSFK